MPGPVRAATDVQPSGGNNANTLTSSSATAGVSNGDVIVVKVQTWDTGVSMSAPSGGGQTFTAAQVSAPGGFKTYSATYVCTVSGSPGSFSITSTPSASSFHSMTVERWTSAKLAATPAVLVTTNGTTNVSSTLTTTAANSVISWGFGDENSRDPATIGSILPAGSTQDGLYDGHVGSNSVQYYYVTGVIASAGTVTLGATNSAGAMAWNASGVEILENAGGATVTLAAAFTGTGSLAVADRAETTLAAPLVGTGSLAAALTRQVNLAAGFTGTGTLTAADRAETTLSVPLSGQGTLSVGLTRQANLAAGFVGTGSLAAALTRQVNAAAALTATGSMSVTDRAETTLAAGLSGQGLMSASFGTVVVVDMAAAFTATGTMADALTRQANLAAALAGGATMTVAYRSETTVGAALTATGSMSATLTAGTQTVNLSANLTATAGMTAVFSLPQIGPTDPIAQPVAEQLMACFIDQLSTLIDPPTYTQIRVGQDGGPLMGPNIDECCAGLAWIRVDSVYPSWDSFPAEDNTWTPCGPLAYAVVIEMGVAFCMPWSDSDESIDNLDPPSAADWQSAFQTQMTHQTLMRRAAACCFPSTQRRAVGAWTPLPVEGGCTGGKLLLTVSVMAPCSDC